MLKTAIKTPIARAMSTTKTTGHAIRTAGCLIIGDEVLNGKITDSNSKFFAKMCFQLGVELKNVMVVSDDRTDIVDGVRYLDKRCDFIVTSGGIGPTHDDITYESLAEAFGNELHLDPVCVDRMNKLRKSNVTNLNKDQLDAQYRMATLPSGPNVTNIYVDEKLWVPIVSINHKVHVLPGVPQLFERLVTELIPHIKDRIVSTQFERFFVKTAMKESELAPYLTNLQNKCNVDLPHKIKIGSYPHMGLGINTISIIGNLEDLHYLRELVKDVSHNLNGQEISAEEEDELSRNKDAVKL